MGRAFIKYGIENFTFKILEECLNNEMSEREIYWIHKLNTCVKDKNSWGYNMTHGGERLFGDENPFYGKTHSEKNKRLLSERGKKRVGELNPFYGKTHTNETKQKISNANKNHKWEQDRRDRFSQNQRGEGNYFYGKRHSEETKRKISEKRKGCVPSNAIPWIAFTDTENIYFASVGKIMQWLLDNSYITENEHYTMAMLKNNLKKSENKQIKYMGYYWKKSVETIENIDNKNQEVSRVGSEIDTESKREDIA